jgi:hypothetical protein
MKSLEPSFSERLKMLWEKAFQEAEWSLPGILLFKTINETYLIIGIDYAVMFS